MRRWLAAIAAALVVPAQPSAHNLDEYLQATRVSFARDRVALDVDLTPGASIASAIITVIDRDGDGAISPEEAAAYGHAVLGDLTLDVDGSPVRLTLTHAETPAIDEMHEGLGTIRIRAAGPIEAGSGRRVLAYRNHHQPAASVYLANALIPDDRDAVVVAQIRDPKQIGIRIEYQVGPTSIAKLTWLLIGGVGLAGLIAFRAS
jgi:hypothetical protein